MIRAVLLLLALLAAGCYPEGTRWPTETGVRAP
jgi:hypothetical protein